MVKFGVSNVPNLTMSQIHIGHGRVWGIQAFDSQTYHVPNLSRSIWDMVGFGTFDSPNLTISQTYLGQFGTWSDLVPYVSNMTINQINWVNLEHGHVWGIWHPNLTMSQIWFGISQVWFGTGQVWDMDHPKSKFLFGKSQIGIPIWDIPSLTWDMVKFGLQHFYIKKVRAML